MDIKLILILSVIIFHLSQSSNNADDVFSSQLVH